LPGEIDSRAATDFAAKSGRQKRPLSEKRYCTGVADIAERPDKIVGNITKTPVRSI